MSISPNLLRKIAHRLGGVGSISTNPAQRIAQESWGSDVDLVQGFRLRGNVIVGSQIDFPPSIGVTPTVEPRSYGGGVASIPQGFVMLGLLAGLYICEVRTRILSAKAQNPGIRICRSDVDLVSGFRALVRLSGGGLRLISLNFRMPKPNRVWGAPTISCTARAGTGHKNIEPAHRFHGKNTPLIRELFRAAASIPLPKSGASVCALGVFSSRFGGRVDGRF